MINVLLQGHSFEFECRDVLRLFFDLENVAFIKEKPHSLNDDLLLCIHMDDREEIFKITLHLEEANRCMFEQVKEIQGVTMDNIQHPRSPEARIIKKEMKRQLYIILKSYTGREIPWGVLTGIRPAKIVQEMIEEGKHKEGIMEMLKEKYFVSERKSTLLYEIALLEKRLLQNTLPDRVSIYIGIPFCPSRCLYCSFTSYPITRYLDQISSYLEAVEKEVIYIGDWIKRNGKKIQSIYIGGGTPTSIEANQLKKLLSMIEEHLDLTDIEEYTIEAGRPDAIDLEKLQAIKESRASRISINPQTMNDETLQLIGRRHTSQQIIEAFQMARKTGIGHINMDIIVGLPGESKEMFKHTLECIEKLSPESVTVHALAIKTASQLKENRDKYRLASEEEALHMIDMAEDFTKRMGLLPYYLYRQKNVVGNLENVGYCKPGYESIYNIQIMEEKQSILGIGAGAVTNVVFMHENRNERVFNVRDVAQYIERIDEMIERKRKLLE